MEIMFIAIAMDNLADRFKNSSPPALVGSDEIFSFQSKTHKQPTRPLRNGCRRTSSPRNQPTNQPATHKNDMKMQPTDFGNQRFNITRIYDTMIDVENGEAAFEIELRLRHTHQKLFFGLLDTQRLDNREFSVSSGIAVSIDPMSGEIVDLVNSQGIIGYLDETPLEERESIFLCIDVEKLRSIFIPKITVGEERILHPALHLSNQQPISLVVGSTDAAAGALFENPHFMITRRAPGVSA